MPNHTLPKSVYPEKDSFRGSVDHDVANRPYLA